MPTPFVVGGHDGGTLLRGFAVTVCLLLRRYVSINFLTHFCSPQLFDSSHSTNGTKTLVPNKKGNSPNQATVASFSGSLLPNFKKTS
jgi:hypothetical protein